MLGNTKGKQLYNYIKDYVLFDLETTGISCFRDEIIEISALKVRNGQVVEEFSELVNPHRPIPWQASQVNNITDKMVADKPDFAQVLPRFLDFAGEDVLVGHNIAGFDMKFIYRDCERFLGQTLTNDYIDTLNIAKKVFPAWHHRRLGDLAEHYGLSTVGAHRALADCKMNQIVFEKMGIELQNGQKDIETNRMSQANRTCPECGMEMKKRNGRYGEFWGCMGFPGCRHTENV